MNDASALRSPTGSVTPTLAVCAVVLAIVAGLLGHLTRGFELWTYEDLRRDQVRRGELRVAPTSLVNADGASLRAFGITAPGGSAPRPAVYVVDFIYTNCTSVCQTLGAEFYRMQEALRREGRGDVRLLSVSIDPLRDTVPAMHRYAALHRADADRWTIAAPTSVAALRELTEPLGVIAIPDGLGGYVHNGAIHVIDGSGVVLGIHDYDQWETALRQARGRWPSPLPLPQAIWTEDMGDRCAGTWVTLFPPSQREDEVALEPSHREGPTRGIRQVGSPAWRQYQRAVSAQRDQPQDRLQVARPRRS